MAPARRTEESHALVAGDDASAGMLWARTRCELGTAGMRLSAAIGIGCAIATHQHVYWLEGGKRRFSFVDLVHVRGRKRGGARDAIVGSFRHGCGTECLCILSGSLLLGLGSTRVNKLR